MATPVRALVSLFLVMASLTAPAAIPSHDAFPAHDPIVGKTAKFKFEAGEFTVKVEKGGFDQDYHSIYVLSVNYEIDGKSGKKEYWVPIELLYPDNLKPLQGKFYVMASESNTIKRNGIRYLWRMNIQGDPYNWPPQWNWKLSFWSDLRPYAQIELDLIALHIPHTGRSMFDADQIDIKEDMGFQFKSESGFVVREFSAVRVK